MIFVITSCTATDKSAVAEEEKPVLLAMSSSKNQYDDFSMLFTLNKDKSFEWRIIRNSKNSIYENRNEKGTYELDGDTIRLMNNKRFKIAILKDGYIEFIDQCMRLQLRENHTGIEPFVTQQKRADIVFFTAHPLNFMTRKKGASFDLKPNEVDLIENLLDEEIKQHKLERHPNQKAYYKQCISYLNAENERIVKIYGLSKGGGEHDDFWDNEFIMVSDGGEYYFDAEINLTKQELTRFSFNGTA